jgi:hypothetical protein
VQLNGLAALFSGEIKREIQSLAAQEYIIVRCTILLNSRAFSGIIQPDVITIIALLGNSMAVLHRVFRPAGR